MAVELEAGSALRQLARPLQLKGIALKNRIVMPAMVTNFAEADGLIGDRLVGHYASRAAGGVSTVVVEASYVALNGRSFANGVGAYDDSLLPGLRRLADAIHAGGAHAAIQLFHAGRRALPELTGEQPRGPSPIVATTGIVPQELTVVEIRGLVEAFTAAARRVRSAGFDMIELHCAHGYLINQFLSPLSNARGDEYGGSMDGRLRFAVEVLTAVRQEVGAGFPISVRIPGDEFVAGGLTKGDTPEIARRLQMAGADLIDVSGAAPESIEVKSIGLKLRTAKTPKGFFVHLAEAIKTAVTVPVMAVCRLDDPLLAGEVLSGGKADLIGVGRGLLVDPEWPKKALNGDFGDIRRCTYCCGCVLQTALHRPIVCKRNKLLGQEFRS